MLLRPIAIRQSLGRFRAFRDRLRYEAEREPKGEFKERWLVFSNCQTTGLVDCLNLLCDDVQVMGEMIPVRESRISKFRKSLSSFDLIITNHGTANEFGFADILPAEKIRYIPPLNFDAYHPDICYLVSRGRRVASPIGDYNSLLAFTAASAALDIEAALSLYNRRIYHKAGYFAGWEPAREGLIKSFKHDGIDIEQAFLGWARNGTFMYSTNHPKIHVLMDVARGFLRANRLPFTDCDYLPKDELASGPVFPVYPEIAEHFGVHGDYHFKRYNQYKRMGLRQFVGESLEIYRRIGVENIEVYPAYRKRFDETLKIVREAST